ncbi:hypothetical protein ACFPOI_31645 [Nonomuraea angiospora]|uniref:Uncharacterized protein n=1 Tax=Nonomuraea angiospora TaxID=46172 RepID=A0ABR9LSL7_9ACTN|nr:hypothetical protein [Nonomuraea angiospora]MBE1583380.1 hypothetical protein [Nonomuraea angiospora]
MKPRLWKPSRSPRAVPAAGARNAVRRPPPSRGTRARTAAEMTRLSTRVAAVVRSTSGVAAMAAELAATATPAPAPVEHREA